MPNPNPGTYNYAIGTDTLLLLTFKACLKLFENFFPGFSRLSLPWFAPDDVIDYILDCIIFVAEQGWKFMVHYDVNPNTGEWSHISKLKTSNSFCLDKISYNNGFFEYQPRPTVASGPANSAHPVNLKDYLTDAWMELEKLTNSISELYVPDLTNLFQGKAALLRWVILPSEAKDLLIEEDLTATKKVLAENKGLLRWVNLKESQITEVEKKIQRKRPPLAPAFTPIVYQVLKNDDKHQLGSLHGITGR